MHEAQLHKSNSFLTLTYSDEALASRRTRWEPTVPYTPPSGEESAHPDVDAPNNSSLQAASSYQESLRPRDVQLFIKRLRFSQSELGLAKVRHFSVGEYGDKTGRPHYHIALFGEDFSGDRKQWRTSSGYPIYRSPRLEKLWPHGNSEIGELTTDSAAYIARYVMKKINGKKAHEHYRRETPDGEIYYLVPEFALMSRRPGIGRDWLTKHNSDVYPHDHVIVNGHKFKPPRYYDKLLATWDPTTMELIKFQREIRAQESDADNTPARLADKETVTQAKMAFKKRNLE